MKNFPLVVLKTPPADSSCWAGEWDLTAAKWKKNWGSSRDQQYVWRAGAGAASPQDSPHHRLGEHLQLQAKGPFHTLSHMQLLLFFTFWLSGFVNPFSTFLNAGPPCPAFLSSPGEGTHPEQLQLHRTGSQSWECNWGGLIKYNFLATHKPTNQRINYSSEFCIF